MHLDKNTYYILEICDLRISPNLLLINQHIPKYISVIQGWSGNVGLYFLPSFPGISGNGEYLAYPRKRSHEKGHLHHLCFTLPIRAELKAPAHTGVF